MPTKNTILKTCDREGCGNQVLTSPNRLADGRGKYCSPACRGGNKKVFVRRTCQAPGCEKNFITTEATIGLGGGKYCSPLCYQHRKGSFSERFWSYVDKSPGQGPKGECWTWTGGTSGADGYGTFKINAKDSMAAHRVAWELEHGPIPEGMCVLHRCDNPPCVRCLFLGTRNDNNQDRDRKGRSYRKLTIDQVRQSRIRLENGATLAALAHDYGVSQSLIGSIKSGRRWKRV